MAAAKVLEDASVDLPGDRHHVRAVRALHPRPPGADRRHRLAARRQPARARDRCASWCSAATVRRDELSVVGPPAWATLARYRFDVAVVGHGGDHRPMGDHGPRSRRRGDQPAGHRAVGSRYRGRRRQQGRGEPRRRSSGPGDGRHARHRRDGAPGRARSPARRRGRDPPREPCPRGARPNRLSSCRPTGGRVWKDEDPWTAGTRSSGRASRSSRCCTSRACRAGPGTTSAAGRARLVDVLGRDLETLQEAGVDGVLFCNEADLPYQLEVGPEIATAMAAAIGELRRDVKVPFGVNLLWDAIASLAVARATGASFIREVLTGVYESDLGMIEPRIGEIAGYRPHDRSRWRRALRQHLARVRQRDRRPHRGRPSAGRGVHGHGRDPDQRTGSRRPVRHGRPARGQGGRAGHRRGRRTPASGPSGLPRSSASPTARSSGPA